MSRHGTKLVCTIGPASVDRLAELAAGGMDVARINLSHGTPEEQASAIGRVRAVDGVALMADLPGPKIRLGDLASPEVHLETGTRFVLRPTDGGAQHAPGDASGADVDDPALANDLRPGDHVLLSDGAVELLVTSTGDEIATEVLRGGTIRSRAGLNAPAERISRPALTDTDRDAIPRLIEAGVDFVAQSFVRRAADVTDLRAHLGETGPPIVAKIETRPAVDDFDAICEAADAVMIARGDLGVELPFEQVPIVQKQLVRRALDRGVPSIVATQMLESMTAAPRPTRAEASDVANAIFDGADAIMLSAETAIGAYPVLAAEAATSIAAECAMSGGAYRAAGAPPSTATDAGALVYAAVALADRDPDVAAIACYTASGRTARLLSSLRPRVPILAYSSDPAVLARLALSHGVEPRACLPPDSGRIHLDLLSSLLHGEPALEPGAPVVLVASSADPSRGANMLEVRRPAPASA